MENNYIYRRSMRQLLKDDTNLRVSTQAAEMLQDYLQQTAKDISQDAMTAARHADKKTIRKEDMKIALPDTYNPEEE